MYASCSGVIPLSTVAMSRPGSCALCKNACCCAGAMAGGSEEAVGGMGIESGLMLVGVLEWHTAERQVL